MGYLQKPTSHELVHVLSRRQTQLITEFLTKAHDDGLVYGLKNNKASFMKKKVKFSTERARRLVA